MARIPPRPLSTGGRTASSVPTATGLSSLFSPSEKRQTLLCVPSFSLGASSASLYYIPSFLPRRSLSSLASLDRQPLRVHASLREPAAVSLPFFSSRPSSSVQLPSVSHPGPFHFHLPACPSSVSSSVFSSGLFSSPASASDSFCFSRSFASRATRRQRERLENNLLSESVKSLVGDIEKNEAAAPLTRANRKQRPPSPSPSPSSSPPAESSFWGSRAEGFSRELSLLHRGRRRDRVGEKILNGGAQDGNRRGEDESVGNVEEEFRRRQRLLLAAEADREDQALRGTRPRPAVSSLPSSPSDLAPFEHDEQEAMSLSEQDLAVACDFVAPAPSSSPFASPSSFSPSSPPPPYRLLTHEEAKAMQEAYSEKLYEDRRRRWLRMYGLPNPEREARLLLRENEEKERVLQEEEEVPGLVGENPGYSARIEKMVRDTKREELVSRIRAKIREEKLANAKLMKAPAPNVAGHIVDAIKYHVARRTVRLGRLIQAQLEEFLTWNSPHMLYSVLDGASVSIHHVEQRTTKSVCFVYYTLTSSHDPEDIQRRLEQAAPQFRMQIARRLQLGYTPEIRFLPQPDGELFNKHRLFKLAAPRKKSGMPTHRTQGKLHDAALGSGAGDREHNFQVLKGGWTKSMHGF